MATSDIDTDFDERPSKRSRLNDRVRNILQPSGAEFEDSEDFYEGSVHTQTPLASNSVTMDRTVADFAQKRRASIPGLGMLGPADDTSSKDTAVTSPVAGTPLSKDQSLAVSIFPQAQIRTADGGTNTTAFYENDSNMAQDVKEPITEAWVSRKEVRSPAVTNPRSELSMESDVSTRHEDATTGATGTAGLPSEFVQGNDDEAQWTYDSSNASPTSSSDLSSSSGSTTSGDDSEEEMYELLEPEEQARLLMQEEIGLDNGGQTSKTGSRTQPRTANEKLEEVYRPNVLVTAQMNIVPLGFAEGVVENFLLIKGIVSGETRVLESGSVLCLEDRTVVGAITETFGRVEAPLYSVAFTSSEEVKGYGIDKGTKICYVESLSTFVFTQPLKSQKGSDASNLHDEEIGDEELEFSDDEAEAEYKRKAKLMRQARKSVVSTSASTIPNEAKRSSLRNLEVIHYPTEPISYDEDEGDGMYTPLARPASLLNSTVHSIGTPDSKQLPETLSSGHDNKGRRVRLHKAKTRSWKHHKVDERGKSLAPAQYRKCAPRQTSPLHHHAPVQDLYQSIKSVPSQSGRFAAPNLPAPAGLPHGVPWSDGHHLSSWTRDYSHFGSHRGAIPPGSFVNPAFLRNQHSPPLPLTQSQHDSPRNQQPGLRRHTETLPLPFGESNTRHNSANEEYDPTRPWIN